jgi:hypothetical protein
VVGVSGDKLLGAGNDHLLRIRVEPEPDCVIVHVDGEIDYGTAGRLGEPLTTPARLIHDRSSTVLPLPAGADTTVTRACAASRPNSRGRETTPPAPGPAAPPATASAPAADPMVPITAPRQPTRPVCHEPISGDVCRAKILRVDLTCRPGRSCLITG